MDEKKYEKQKEKKEKKKKEEHFELKINKKKKPTGPTCFFIIGGHHRMSLTLVSATVRRP